MKVEGVKSVPGALLLLNLIYFKAFSTIIRFTVNPRISPRGLIVNFEILHGGLIEEGAYSREGAY